MQRIFKNYNFLFLLVLSLLFSYYAFIGTITIEPDFGWHLKFGEIIIRTHSIPKLDLFSYTMPSYNFIDHEWLSDVIFASLYPVFGQVVMSLIFAFLTVFALFVQVKNLPKKWLFFPFFLAGMSIAPFTFIRPQVFSVLFFCILLAFLLNKKNFGKWFIFMPFLFLIWANLHGGFFLGLVVFGIAVLTESIESRRLQTKQLIIFIFSIPATLVNPYGINLWKEIFVTFTSPITRQYTEEWFPALFFINLAFFALTILSFILLIKYFRKFRFTEKILYYILFFLALSSVRNVIFFVPVALFIAVKGLDFLYKDLANYPFGQIRFNKLYTVLCVLSIVFFALKIFWSIYVLPANTEMAKYSKKAVEFLHANPSSGQIFSEINWGGYLIWKLPQKKVFIDGRMSNWENASAPKNESKNAYEEYNQILNQKIPLIAEVNKYKIDTFLIPSVERPVNKTTNKFFQFLEFPIFGNPHDTSSLVSELSENGFSLIYKDSVAEVYRKR